MASYRVEVTIEARKELRQIPGHVRARVLGLLHTLERDPSPPGSRQLKLAHLAAPLAPGTTLWRARLDTWRVIYVVDADDRLVSILAIRRRPPYQYEDLNALFQSRRR